MTTCACVFRTYRPLHCISDTHCAPAARAAWCGQCCSRHLASRFSPLEAPKSRELSPLIPCGPTHLHTHLPQAERDRKLEEERKLELQRKIKDAQRREKQKEEDAKRKEQVSRVRVTPTYVFISD